MKKKAGINLTTLDEFLDKHYGKRGTAEREQWEQEYEAVKIGFKIEEERMKQGMTREELAEKCGTSKAFISRVENNAADVRLSTLMHIIQKGLGGRLKLTLEV